MKKSAFICALLSVLLAGGAAYAAITVVSVRGEASFSSAGQWKPLAKGMPLEEGTKVCTGVRSSLVIDIDSHLVTIGAMSSVKIYKNTSTASSSETSLGLQYGSVRAKVKKTAGVKTRFLITTPVATSSVRGTDEIVTYGPSGMTVRTIEGAVRAFSAAGAVAVVSGRSRFALSDVGAKQLSLLDDLRGAAVADVVPDNMTAEEKESVERSGGDEIGSGMARTSTGTARVTMKVGWP